MISVSIKHSGEVVSKDTLEELVKHLNTDHRILLNEAVGHYIDKYLPIEMALQDLHMVDMSLVGKSKYHFKKPMGKEALDSFNHANAQVLMVRSNPLLLFQSLPEQYQVIWEGNH